jgi:replication factor A1
LEERTAKVKDLKPGMEGLTLRVRILQIQPPREVKTKIGRLHRLVDGLAEDESGQIPITFWNEQIDALTSIKPGDVVEMKNCFVSSFKGEKRINAGRGAEIRKIE